MTPFSIRPPANVSYNIHPNLTETEEEIEPKKGNWSSHNSKPCALANGDLQVNKRRNENVGIGKESTPLHPRPGRKYKLHQLYDGKMEVWTGSE
jgi:hypothetical protein